MSNGHETFSNGSLQKEMLAFGKRSEPSDYQVRFNKY